MSADGAMEGGCRCGQVRFRVTGGPAMTSACHCTGCQRMTGGAYSLTSMYPDDRFELLSGEPVIGGMQGDIRHHHCPHCLSWVFTRAEMLGPLVNVRTTMLDTPPADPPFLEIYTKEALPWAMIGARHAFPTFPPMDRFQPLLAEFAAAHTGAA